MLVATAGQTASYPLSSAPKKICHSSAATTKNSNNNLSKVAAAARASSNKFTEVSGAASTTASALMKTLSVRLNRGTEFLKDTVQKVLPPLTTSANSNNNIAITSTSNTAHAGTTTTLKTIPYATFLKLYTIPPTTLHRYPNERLQANSTDSHDSLYKEMCHFKPIRLAPITLRKSAKGQSVAVKTPKASLATKINENLNCDDTTVVGDTDETATFRPKPTSVLLTKIVSTHTHKSAFVCLRPLSCSFGAVKRALSRKKKSSGKRRKLPKSQQKRRTEKSRKKPAEQEPSFAKTHTRRSARDASAQFLETLPNANQTDIPQAKSNANKSKRKVPEWCTNTPQSNNRKNEAQLKRKMASKDTGAKSEEAMVCLRKRTRPPKDADNVAFVAGRRNIKVESTQLADGANDSQISGHYIPPMTRAQLRRLQEHNGTRAVHEYLRRAL